MDDKAQIAISTSQAVVGGIIGWNLFTGSPTDTGSLSAILLTWVTGPILAGASLGFILLKIVAVVLRNSHGLHMLHLDAHTRTGLMIVGAIAAYFLGANNIANVMGMFVPASPFSRYDHPGLTAYLGYGAALSGSGVSRSHWESSPMASA